MTSTEFRTRQLTLTAERAAAAPHPHHFAMPTVHETRRPAEPAWLASTW